MENLALGKPQEAKAEVFRHEIGPVTGMTANFLENQEALTEGRMTAEEMEVLLLVGGIAGVGL